MPLAIIHAPYLSRDQKNRIGNRVLEALHAEGFTPGSILVLFRPEDADIYVDGGLVHECPRGQGVPEPPLPGEGEDGARTRRAKPDLGSLRGRLIQALQARGQMSSFDAQTELGLKDDENGAGILRRLFAELEAEGLIIKQGQKRGTRYVWQDAGGPVTPSVGAPILMKKDDEDE